MDQPLHLAVLAAAAWAAGGLAFAWLRAKSYGRRVLLAPAAGDPTAGVRYAFTAAMLPQAKESVRMHLPSYAAGIIFHIGTFAALGLLVAKLAGLALPGLLAHLAAGTTLAGAAAGLALLAKRLLTQHLRRLSTADDYLANTLTTLFAALAGAATLHPPLTPAWLVAAVLLLLFAPLGKIRHCVFFFSSRASFGAFFGYRGTFPSPRTGGA